MKHNKLNEKQLTLIFCIIFALLIAGYFIIQTSQTVPSSSVSPVTKHEVSVPSSLTEEEKQLLEEVRSAKPAPLSPTEEAMLQQVRSSKPEPLTEGEEAMLKRMRGI